VREVRLDDDTGTATVIVSDYQLSLAIGKEGQNARLAARLTGWRIDIKSETQLAEEESGYAGEEWAEGEWIQNEAGEMVWQPAEGGTAVSATEWSQGADGAEVVGPEASATSAPDPASVAGDGDSAEAGAAAGVTVSTGEAVSTDEAVSPQEAVSPEEAVSTDGAAVVDSSAGNRAGEGTA
jgi:transcription termination/antitermination protein NusA